METTNWHELSSAQAAAEKLMTDADYLGGPSCMSAEASIIFWETLVEQASLGEVRAKRRYHFERLVDEARDEAHR